MIATNEQIITILRSHHLYAPDYDDGISDVCQCGFDLSPCGIRDNDPDGIDAEHARHVAEFITALPSRPDEETVTTEEELDALPHTTYIVDRYGSFLALEVGEVGRYWFAAGHEVDRDPALPARVLYRPALADREGEK